MRKTLAETKVREEKGEAQVRHLRASISELSQEGEAWREKLTDKAAQMTVLETDRNALEEEVRFIGMMPVKVHLQHLLIILLCWCTPLYNR